MKQDYKILAESYKKLFYETMNPVFWTLASYMENNKTSILLDDFTNELTL